MIQRIQSFYLVLALVGIVLLFLFPTANFEALSEQQQVSATSSLDLIQLDSPDINLETGVGVYPQGSILLTIIAFVIGIGVLVDIFMYKNRVRQMKLASILAFVNCLYIALMFLVAIPNCEKFMPNLIVETSYTVGTFIPIVTLILIVLAQRAIRSDELKVRAADRLR